MRYSEFKVYVRASLPLHHVRTLPGDHQSLRVMDAVVPYIECRSLHHLLVLLFKGLQVFLLPHGKGRVINTYSFGLLPVCFSFNLPCLCHC